MRCIRRVSQLSQTAFVAGVRVCVFWRTRRTGLTNYKRIQAHLNIQCPMYRSCPARQRSFAVTLLLLTKRIHARCTFLLSCFFVFVFFSLSTNSMTYATQSSRFTCCSSKQQYCLQDYYHNASMRFYCHYILRIGATRV